MTGAEAQRERRQRLDKLLVEVANLKRDIEQFVKACRHDWGDPISDPIKTPRMVFSHYEGHGSDPTPRYKQAGWDTKPRWKRVCTRCGHTEFTERQVPAAMKPDFG